MQIALDKQTLYYALFLMPYHLSLSSWLDKFAACPVTMVCILFGTIIIICCQCTFLATPCVFPSQKNHLLFLCNQLLGILQKYVIMLKVALLNFLLGLFFKLCIFEPLYFDGARIFVPICSTFCQSSPKYL